MGESPEKRILVVDDTPGLAVTMAAVIRQKMTELGHRAMVVAATSGNEAVRLFGNETFALVITDLQMPGIDGHGVVEHFQEPTIAIRIMTTRVDLARTINGVKIFEKPVTPTMLLDLLTEVFGNAANKATEIPAPTASSVTPPLPATPTTHSRLSDSVFSPLQLGVT